MKKLLAVILVCVTVLILVACGQQKKEHELVYEKFQHEQFPFNDETLDCITVYTEYTNYSGEVAIPADNVEVKAYQGGVELSPWVFTGQEINGYLQCDTRIQNETTAKIIWIFELKDNTGITIEMPDGTKHEVGW